MRDTLRRWYGEGDLNFSKLILSPERPVDLKTFTRDVMAAVERDHGVRLDWLAVIHTNTNQPHVHVVVRHKDLTGRQLQLTQDYLHHTLRNRAREEITRMIGYRDPADVMRQEERCQEKQISRKLSREPLAIRASAFHQR